MSIKHPWAIAGEGEAARVLFMEYTAVSIQLVANTVFIQREIVPGVTAPYGI